MSSLPSSTTPAASPPDASSGVSATPITIGASAASPATPSNNTVGTMGQLMADLGSELSQRQQQQQLQAPPAQKPSYDVSHTSLTGSFSRLLDAALTDVAQQPVGAPAAAPPAWVASVRKLQAVFQRLDATDPISAMFERFFAANSAELSRGIIGEDGAVNDSFYRGVEPCKPAPPAGAAACAEFRGPTAYFDAEKAALAAVCLPVGEVYRAALARHREATAAAAATAAGRGGGGAVAAAQLLPTLVLLEFTSCIYHSLPDGHAALPALEANLADLCSAAETVAPGTGPGAEPAAPAADAGQSSSASPFSISMIENMLSAMTGNAAGGAGVGDAIRSISSMVTDVVARVSDTAPGAGGRPSDPAAVVARLSSILGDREMQNRIAQAAASASAAFEGISGGGGRAATATAAAAAASPSEVCDAE